VIPVRSRAEFEKRFGQLGGIEHRARPLGGAAALRSSKTGLFDVQGYAAVFNSNSLDLGGFIERIAPGAFDSALGSDHDTILNINHDDNRLLARLSNNTLSLKTDSAGLTFRGAAPDTTYARDLRALLQGEYVTGASFAFTINDDEWSELPDGRVLRTINEIGKLFDVSVVYPFGAYPKASSELVRQLRTYARKSAGIVTRQPRSRRAATGSHHLKLKGKAAAARSRLS
jgi:HK97 family phage prohead protease